MTTADIKEEITDQEADDAFNSGFGETEPTATPAPLSEPRTEEPAVSVAVTEAPKYRQITEAEHERLMKTATAFDEYRATVDQKFNTAFGKMGGYDRTLKAIEGSTPAGQPVKITDAMIAEITADYVDFPEMGKAHIRTLQRFADQMKGTGKADPKAIQDQVVAQVRAREQEALEDLHPDWMKTIGAVNVNAGEKPDPNHPFRKWLAGKDAGYQKRVIETQSAGVLSRAITRFQEETKPKPKTDTSQRTQRLLEAITPRGDGGNSGSPKPARDPFLEGFASG